MGNSEYVSDYKNEGNYWLPPGKNNIAQLKAERFLERLEMRGPRC